MQQTKLFVVDRAARPLPFEDADVASLIARRLAKGGVTFHSASELMSLEKIKDKADSSKERVRYVLRHTNPDGSKETVLLPKLIRFIPLTSCSSFLTLFELNVF